jgi:hypothetical protein
VACCSLCSGDSGSSVIDYTFDAVIGCHFTLQAIMPWTFKLLLRAPDRREA